MPRDLRPARPVAPPLVYAGEREQLLAERAEILGKLRRNGSHSAFRPALLRSFNRVTARLVAIGAEAPPVPGLARKDLQ